MKELNEPVKFLESGMNGQDLPDEYVEKAKALVENRRTEEKRLRAELSEVFGRDDRLSHTLSELDMKLRKDLAALRKEYCIKPAQK